MRRQMVTTMYNNISKRAYSPFSHCALISYCIILTRNKTLALVFEWGMIVRRPLADLCCFVVYTLYIPAPVTCILVIHGVNGFHSLTCKEQFDDHVAPRNLGNFCVCIRSTAQGIRNTTNDWNPESKFHWKRLESSTWNQESTVWNPESRTFLDSLTWGEQCLTRNG